jgi:hypothetical protein
MLIRERHDGQIFIAARYVALDTGALRVHVLGLHRNRAVPPDSEVGS